MKTIYQIPKMTAVFGSLFALFLSAMVVGSVPFDLSTSNMQSSFTNTAQTNGFFKTVINQSGDYAIVAPDKETVTLKSSSGNIIWSTNVIERLKEVPMSGERKINGLQVVKGQIVVTVSRGYAHIDKKTGEVTWMGSD